MSAALGHFLITRFNIPVSFKGSEKRLSPEWLDRRFELFERYCLPSVASQTTRDFTWLVLMDSQTPPRFQERLNRCQSFFPLRTVLVEDSWRDSLLRELASLLSPGARHILTARLDSDDAIGRGFMGSVQEAARGKDSGVFLFPRGFVLHQGRLYVRDYPANPFASLLEASPGFKTVLQATHDRLGTLAAVTNVSEEPSWLQVIHGGNASNTVAGLRVWGAKARLEGPFPMLAGEPLLQEGPLEWAADFARSLRSWRGAFGPARRALRGAFR